LVPTSAERGGDFRDFAGIITDPLSGQPFPENIIPTSVLGGFYAFRLAPSNAVPEPSPLNALALGGLLIAIFLWFRRVSGRVSASRNYEQRSPFPIYLDRAAR
jgi:hypothetical protein